MVLDIGTEEVKSIIIKQNPNDEKGYIAGYGKSQLNPEDTSNGIITNINSVAEKANSAIEKAVQLSGYKPDRIISGVSGTEIISTINKISYHRKKPTQKISTQEFQTIFTQIQKESRQKLISQLRSQNKNTEIELINAAILSVKIDDKTIINPVNFTGENLIIEFYSAYAPVFQINALQSVIDELKLNLISIFNHPFALTHAIDIKQYQYRNSLLVDIGGEITNIAFINDGIVLHTDCFSFGSRQFTQALAKEMDISFQKADQYKTDYAGGLLTQDTENSLNPIFRPLAELWIKQLKSKISQYNLRPRKIYACGGGTLMPEIKEILLSDWYKDIAEYTRPVVKFIHPVDIEKLIDKTTFIKTPKEIPILALASVGLKLHDSESASQKIINKVVQTLRN